MHGIRNETAKQYECVNKKMTNRSRKPFPHVCEQNVHIDQMVHSPNMLDDDVTACRGQRSLGHGTSLVTSALLLQESALNFTRRCLCLQLHKNT
uniref:Uncharacterized protein n=1 Tax=Ascaris lumbricoides TaxID=6252 RepID=A0A0M3HM98_ASCLU